MTFIIRLSILIGLFILVDIYAFQAVRVATAGLSSNWRQGLRWGYWIISLFIYLSLLYSVLSYNSQKGPAMSLYYFFGIWLLFFLPKLVISVFLLGEDIFRVFKAGYNQMASHTSSDIWEGRRKFISTAGIIAAAVPFVSIIHGLTIGRYNFKVKRNVIYFPDLPESFDGFTITQISDLHCGGFDSKSAVEEAVRMVNEQQSDVLLFTGDLVNNLASEVSPYLEILQKLQRPEMGMFSVLGNHDYGEYVNWDSKEEAQNNLLAVQEMNRKIGFRLLMNEHELIEKNGHHVAILGVENWGGGGFPKYGDLDAALNQLNPDVFKILLSHDPTHWDRKVLPHEQHIHLTLSGHTHGMQFGVEIPGYVKWSPIKWRYPRWAGLYTENGQHIYVNRGLGCLGFPGRVGIWPEITVLELRRGTARSS